MQLLGAAAAGSGVVRPSQPVVNGVALPYSSASAMASEGPVVGVGRNTAWDAFYAAKKPYDRRRRRDEIATALRGGWPPHIATCQSWSPSFRAQRAALWIEQQELREEGLIEALRRDILGEDA